MMMSFFIRRIPQTLKVLLAIMKDMLIWLEFSELSIFLSYLGTEEIFTFYKITTSNCGNKKVERYLDMKKQRNWANFTIRFFSSNNKIFNIILVSRLLKIIKILKTTRAIRILKIRIKIKWKTINIILKWTVPPLLLIHVHGAQDSFTEKFQKWLTSQTFWICLIQILNQELKS